MELNIAVCGQMDAGKSMIANGLLGYELLKEANPIRHKNRTVIPYSWKDTDRNFQVTVIDAHGFEDLTDNTRVETSSQNIDLLLYMISVKGARPMLVDKIILEQLKDVFDASVWNHSIVVLTFANAIIMEGKVKHGSYSKSKIACQYHETIKNWRDEIQEVFRDVGLSCDVPILAAGNQYRFSLLDDNKYWLTDLYYTAVDRIVAEKKDLLTFMNCHRFLDGSKVKHGHFETEIWRHPLVIAEDPQITRKMKTFGIVAGAEGTGGVAGVAGSGIGATIGALAIGLPTFGVAAGAGLIIGGVIGAAMATVVSMAMDVGAEETEKKKSADKITEKQYKRS